MELLPAAVRAACRGFVHGQTGEEECGKGLDVNLGASRLHRARMVLAQQAPSPTKTKTALDYEKRAA